MFEELVGGTPHEQTPHAALESRFDRLYIILISLHGLVSARGACAPPVGSMCNKALLPV